MQSRFVSLCLTWKIETSLREQTSFVIEKCFVLFVESLTLPDGKNEFP